jgi:hypothetical protein
LFRPISDPTKFFGLELGSQSKYDRTADRAIVNGAHDGSVLAQHLENFIKLFVLCPGCKCVLHFCCLFQSSFRSPTVILLIIFLQLA